MEFEDVVLALRIHGAEVSRQKMKQTVSDG